MSELGSRESIPSPFPEHVSAIFAQLAPSDVEQFYKSYSRWSLQQRIEILQIEIKALQQAIIDNERLMQQVRPSPIALASLAQLQASGVDDSDLLDRMLERGDIWLDHTLQLLKHCEELDVIGGNYTQWCENALEDAYDWIESMNDSETAVPAGDAQAKVDTATEEQLLQKLMSEEPASADESASVAAIEENSADVTGSEDDTSPTMKRSALSAITSTAIIVQQARPAPQRRRGGSRHLLHRVLASFWHG